MLDAGGAGLVGDRHGGGAAEDGVRVEAVVDFFALEQPVGVDARLGDVEVQQIENILSPRDRGARQAAGELAGTLRYLFDTAALRHATCRLAIDVDGQAFWPECAPGAATLAGDRRIDVVLSDGGQAQIEAEAIVIATGSAPNRPGDIHFDDDIVFDSTTVLRLPRMPRSMIVLGAGALDGSIRLDGKLDEPAWQQAPRIDNLTMSEPTPGAAPSGRTIGRPQGPATPVSARPAGSRAAA